MNSPENNWDFLWKLFEKLTNKPKKAHGQIIALAQLDEETQKELNKLLQAHYSSSTVLDEQPQWHYDLNQAFLPPDEIHGYTIEKKLGSGGMGEVYLASKAEDGFMRKVAIKFATTGRFSQHVLNSFNTELSVLLSLNHANIERLYDGGITEDNVPFLIVEHIDGMHIDQHCDHYKLNLKQRLQIFQKSCAAVAAVHRSLIVHRDIKAGNIMVGKDGEPKLLDFGLAKLTNAEKDKTNKQTTLSAQMMTLAYASPEQINAEVITTASDVYSLGVLLYYLSTGKMPYKVQDKNLSESIKKITEQETKFASKNTNKDSVIFESETKLVKKLSGDLEQIIAKAIDKSPQGRYSSAEQLSEDIQNYLEKKPVLAKRDSVFYRLAKFIQRHKIGVTLTLMIISSLLYLSTNLYLQSNNLKQSLIEIKQEQKRVLQVTSFLKNIFKTTDPLLTDKKIVNVKELLDYSSNKLESQFNDEPKTKAVLYLTLGNVYLNLSDLSQAEIMFSKATQINNNLQNEKSNLQVELAQVRLMQQQGKFKQAGSKVSALYDREKHNTNPLIKADIEILYAQNLYELRQLKKAEQLFNSALVKRINAYGDEHEQVVDIYLLLGHVYWRLGDFDKVKVNYQKAHKINQKIYGEKNHKTLKSLSSLAILAYAQGNYGLAIKHANYVAEARLEKLGKNHLITAESLNRLGAFYYESGEFNLALEKLTLAKESYESINLNNSRGYALTLNNLGLIERQNRQYSKAQESFQESFKIQAEVLGLEHDGVGTAYNNLGLVAADLGDINKAIGLFKKAYSLYKTIYNEDHIKLAFSMTNIGRMYLYKQEPNQAGIWISKALLMRQKKLGEESLYYVESLMASAEIDLINKEFQIANKKLKQVLKVRQAQLPADDWRTAEAKALYSLTDLKKEANAINSYFCSLWQVSEKLGKTHYRVQMLKNKQKIFNLAQKVAEQHKSNPCEYLALKID